MKFLVYRLFDDQHQNELNLRFLIHVIAKIRCRRYVSRRNKFYSAKPSSCNNKVEEKSHIL